jgi:ubiquinone/menaquinone biosynthesis C-methylase UbiE
MEYLPPAGQSQQLSGAEKYHGAVASGYDAKRENSAKWQVEQAVIESMLDDLPPGSWLLDAPCGTGRFIDFAIRKQLVYRGVDLSADMISQAAARTDGKSATFTFTLPDGSTHQEPQLSFMKGNVLNSGIPDKSVDAVMNIRVTRWLSPEECQRMFTEMMRISRDRIILTARVCQHQFARPLALFEAVMSPEWRLERSECGASGPADAPVEDPAYRIFLFKRRSARQQYPGHIVFDAVKNADDAWVMDPYEAA